MKLGLILSHTGLAGLWTPGCEGGAMLAVAEFNARGGALGQEIELINADAGDTPESAFAAAQRLVLDERVDAVIGLQSSNLRSAVRKGIAGLAPYIYTPHYEGGYCGPSTATLGITDTEVLDPGIHWLAQKRKAQRYFFVGNDYIWPRVAYGTTEHAVSQAGGRIVGRGLIPLGSRDYCEILDQIRQARPHVVVIAMLGEDAVCFNRAFAEAGLAGGILRLSLAFDETQLLGVSAEYSENLFAAQAYFDTSRGRDRDEMVENYNCNFEGIRPGVTANAVNCYDAVYLVAALAQQVGRIDGYLMAQKLKKRLSRAHAYNLIGRSAEDSGVLLAEADGIDFLVRETL
ncbi:MAG TPA: substrate-binding domain-containing protein [Paenirhodobacter sp.]